MKQAVYTIDGFDDIGLRLFEYLYHDRRLPVREARIPPVFKRIFNRRDIRQTYGSASSETHNQRPVLLRLEKLIGGGHLPGVLSVRQLAFRPIRIGRRERRQDLFPPDIEFRQRCRIDQDTHGGTRTPLNIDDSDAWDLSNLLIEDRVGNVVHLSAFLDPGGQRQNNYRLVRRVLDRKSTRLNSSHITISYAVFC